MLFVLKKLMIPLKTGGPEAGPSQVCRYHFIQLLTETGFYYLFIVTEKVEAEWLSSEC